MSPCLFLSISLLSKLPFSTMDIIQGQQIWIYILNGDGRVSFHRVSPSPRQKVA